MKPTKKYRILLKNGGHLADLLIVPLHHGDHSLKFSFKNKLSHFKAHPRQKTATIQEGDFTKPNLIKNTPEGESFEISYIFEKRQLEVKQEGKEGVGINRIHFNVVHPIDRPLFTIFLRNSKPLTMAVSLHFLYGSLLISDIFHKE
jgi:hypothetical protein